jgi:hypothetical protein
MLVVRGKVVDVLDAMVKGREFRRTGDSLTLMKLLDRSVVLEMASYLHFQARCEVQSSSYNTLYHRAAKSLLCYDKGTDGSEEQWNKDLESALQILETQQKQQGSPGASRATSSVILSEEDAVFKKYTNKFSRKSIRPLFLTRQRRLLGLSPPLSEVGDLVCILHGSKTPIILRRSATAGRFHVIGQAYLEGWMHGNHIDWGEDDADVFELE